MKLKKKGNSNTNLKHIKINKYQIYEPLKHQIKSLFGPRKNSVVKITKTPASKHKHLSRFKNITQEQVLKILSKDKTLRIDIENRVVADYLSDNFDYFYQIKESSSEQYLKLMSVLNVESIQSNKIIINIGEENNNFYVLFEGAVLVYRQYKYKKDMTFSEFCKYLQKLKLQNKEEYKIILKNNSHLDLNFEEIMNDRFYYLTLKNKIFNFYIEEFEEIGKYKEGYSFGELSLINKKNSDVIIKTVTNCKLISVSKFDYNRILRTLEEKRLEKKAILFKESFPIFKLWSMEQLITLFNYCNQEIIQGEEFIYKQNDESEYIYFIEEGTIVQYTNVSFSWYLQFIEYIKSFNNNLLESIKNINFDNTQILFNNRNSGELHKKLNNILTKLKIENHNKKYKEKYPFFNIEDIYMKRKKDLIKISELYSKENKIKKVDNFYKIKYEENDINNPEKIYKIPINTIDYPCILGLEETFELKKRFTSIGCISGQVRLKKIKIIDLLRILYYYIEFNYIENIIDIVLQKKTILCETIKTHMQKIGQNFENSMNDKYEKIITQPNLISYKNNKSNSFNISNKIKNEILIATKLKTWDNGSYLDNILDTSLHLLNKKPSKQIKLEKKKKYQNLEKLFKTKHSSNEKKFLSTKFCFEKISLKKPLYLSKYKKIKLKSLEKKIKKEKYIDNFFNTSVFPKKNIGISRNIIKTTFEEIKNGDNICIKTFDKFQVKKNNLAFTDRPSNLKKDIFYQNENINFNKPFKKLINYKVSEDYFENNKESRSNENDENDNNGNNDNNDNKDKNLLSCLIKEKEIENIQSGISTNDKEKDKIIINDNLNNDLIKKNLHINILSKEK